MFLALFDMKFKHFYGSQILPMRFPNMCSADIYITIFTQHLVFIAVIIDLADKSGIDEHKGHPVNVDNPCTKSVTRTAKNSNSRNRVAF